MSKYLKRVMLPDEEIIYQTELHWIIYFKGFFVVVCGVLAARWGSQISHALFGAATEKMLNAGLERFAVLVIAIGALQLLWTFIRQISTELVITNYRVIAKFGFVATTTFEVMMSKVEGANIDQSVLGRILGFGTVMVRGTGGGLSPIDHIANPTRFQSNLLMSLDRSQRDDTLDTAKAHAGLRRSAR